MRAGEFLFVAHATQKVVDEFGAERLDLDLVLQTAHEGVFGEIAERQVGSNTTMSSKGISKVVPDQSERMSLRRSKGTIQRFSNSRGVMRWRPKSSIS
jgi:hypothetical protein